jgi:hypothetical protein
VDQHRFDADPDPDPNFHVDASPGPDPDPDWHQCADPTPSFTHVGKSDFYFIFTVVTSLPLYHVLSFSSVSNVSNVFQHSGQHIEIFWKKVYFINFFICLNLDPAK